MCKNPKYAVRTHSSTYNCIDAEPKSYKMYLISKDKYYAVDKNNKPLIQEHAKIIIPCGKCFECKVSKANEWATRCYLESKIYKQNCFITLTYNNKKIPKIKGKYTLKKEDLTKFKKSLREHLYRKFKKRVKIKTFECGEYGTEKGRPHYHMLIWGYRPEDLKYFKQNKYGNKYYTSKEIKKIWGKGFIIIGNVETESANYVARYIRKENKKDYIDIEPAYCNMSRKEGIGKKYWELNKEKIKKNNYIMISSITKDTIIVNVPKYIKELWRKEEIKNIVEQIKKENNKLKIEELKNECKELKEYQRKTSEKIKKIKEKIKEKIKYKRIIHNRLYIIKKRKIEIWRKYNEEIKTICERYEYENEYQQIQFDNIIKIRYKINKDLEKLKIKEQDYNNRKSIKIKEQLKKLKRGLE